MTVLPTPSPSPQRFPANGAALPSHTAWTLAAAVMSALLIWFGLMGWLGFSVEALVRSGTDPATARWLAPLRGSVQLLLGLLMLPGLPRPLRAGAALGAALWWWGGLFGLADAGAWKQTADFAGFPWLGGGQSLIKGLGLGALAWALHLHWRRGQVPLRSAGWLLWAGQLLVLGWIGLLKFSAYEAAGVEGIMRPSPLFSWLYTRLDVQGASNVIGVIELLTFALILAGPWQRRLGQCGLLLAIGTYVLTQTFLFTTPAWQAGYPAPVVGGSGQFLLKDLGLLAGAVLLLYLQPRASRRAG